MQKRTVAAALVALALCAWPQRARAEGGAQLTWSENWTRVGPIDYAAVGVLGIGSAGAFVGFHGTTEPGWTGRNALDDAGRDALRIHTRSGRRAAGIASDVFYYGFTAYPAVVESLLLAYVKYDSPDVAWQLFVTYGETALSATFFTLLAQGGARRARPLYSECQSNSDYDPLCGTYQQSRSFFAGHVAMAFVGASLACGDGQRVPLYGTGAGPVIVCASMMTGAVATGFLRIAADRHWVTDVLTGATVGLTSGLLLPLGLRYGFGGKGEPPRVSFTPVPVDGGGAVLAAGAFLAHKSSRQSVK